MTAKTDATEEAAETARPVNRAARALASKLFRNRIVPDRKRAALRGACRARKRTDDGD